LCEICRKQEIEKAYKALRLNSGVSYYPYASNDCTPKLLGASINHRKPTIHIKRLRFGHSPYNMKLRGASFIKKRLELERESADKALSLNCGF
jgi:hypothetical protein